MFAQTVSHAQSDASRGHQVTGGPIDLHEGAGTHKELRAWFASSQPVAQASPAVQSQPVTLPIVPVGGQQNLLVIAVAGGVGNSINVGQGFGMAEIAGLA